MKKPSIGLRCHLWFAIVVAGLCNAEISAQNQRPNVLFFLTDDQGYGDLSLHGNPLLSTPTMDSLGKQGVRLDRFYVSPVCAPTRASLLTGRYHLRTGAFGVSHRQEVINPEETTLAELMQQNGYKTGCFGKWHNGAVYPETPNGQGFDEFLGFLGGVWREYYNPVLTHNDTAQRYDGYITDILTDAAIDWMEDRIDEDQPFFCYLPYNAPHTPGLVSEDYWKPFYNRNIGRWESVIYGMIKAIDDQMARVLRFLEEKDQVDNTIVIFITDNGPNTWRYNSGLRGKKSNLYDGGIRVPAFIRWQGKLKPHTVTQPLSHIDLLPTLAELCDLTGTESLDLDGQSFAALLKDPKAKWQDRLLISFGYRDEERIRENGVVHTNRWTAVKDKGRWSLYDIQADVRQFNNLDKQYPDVLRKLSTHFEEFLSSIPSIGVEAPIPVGHEGQSLVVLKGHDANLSGPKGQGIDYNYHAGFTGHWIIDWTDTKAYAQWNLDVVDDATYAATLLFCIPEEDLGVKGYFEVDGQKLHFSINEAFDPEPYSQPFILDGEATKYESKPWKRLPLGRLEIKSGYKSARIRLTDIPGKAGMEVKEVELSRLN